MKQNIDIPRNRMIHWFSTIFFKYENRPHKKVMSISYPGIQPNHLSQSVSQSEKPLKVILKFE